MPGMFATAATEVTRLTNQRRRSESFVLTVKDKQSSHVSHTIRSLRCLRLSLAWGFFPCNDITHARSGTLNCLLKQIFHFLSNI